MQCAIYSFLFQFILSGFKNVNAIIGHNVRQANRNEFPAVACITRYDPDLSWQRKMLCTGTLISPNFVLSAAHCFDAGVRYEIVIGAYKVKNGQRFYPVWWITYNQWALRTIRYYIVPYITDDLQLIKIFGVWRDIDPIPLAPVMEAHSMTGLDVTIVGCGRIKNGTYPKYLQTAELKVLDLEQCSEHVSYLEQQEIELEDKYTCTIADPYIQLAYGDSGGPLLYYGALIGINVATCPRMNDEFHERKVNIHVNMYKYENFLNEYLIPDT